MNEFEHVTDKLIAGGFPLATKACLVSAGEGALSRGTVLGKLTATGKLAVCDKSAEDGSQTPYGVLAEDAESVVAAVAAVKTVTLSGTPVATKIATLVIGANSYAYTVQIDDTATLVAAGLAALVNADGNAEFSAAAASGVITLTAVTAGTAANNISISVTAGDSGVTGVVAVVTAGVDSDGIDSLFPVYLSGEFNPDALIFASGTTAEDMETAMRNVSLFQKEVITL